MSPISPPSPGVDPWAFLAPYYRYKRLELQKGALAEGALPIDVALHLQKLGWAWAVLAPALGVVALTIGWILHSLGVMHSYNSLLAVFGGITAFCLVGGADTIWRYFYADHADRRYWRNDGASDGETVRLVRKALTNDGILIVQIGVGIGLALALR